MIEIQWGITDRIQARLVIHWDFFKVQLRIVLLTEFSLSLDFSELSLVVQVLLVGIWELLVCQFDFENYFSSKLTNRMFRALNLNTPTKRTCERVRSTKPYPYTLFLITSLFLTRLLEG